MPSAFLFVSGSLSTKELENIEHQAQKHLPFTPTTTTRLTPKRGKQHVWSWGALEGAARGAWSHKTKGVSTCFDGWVVEEGEMDQSIAQVMHGMFQDDFEGTAQQLDGSWCALHHTKERTMGATDMAGSQHLFWGVRRGVVAVSNRAILTSIALEHGEGPNLDPSFFGWWLTVSMSHMTSEESPWVGVKGLRFDELFCCDASGHVTIKKRAKPSPYDSWDDARAANVKRCCAWQRTPKLPTQLNLTGGKDSRAILAAIVAAGAHQDLKYAFIQAPPSHPDVLIAQQLCDRLEIPLHVEPITEMTNTPLTEQMQVHFLRTEGLFHSWDLKAQRELQPYNVLTGFFGELYRSHYSTMLRQGWWGVYRLFIRPRALNPYKLQTPDQQEYLSQKAMRWMLKKRAEGWPTDEMRDIWHREVRMRLWATGALRAEHTTGFMMAPLVSAKLIEGYNNQPRRERQAERTHFELMRSGPDWMWQHPFANDTWKQELKPWLGGNPTPAFKRPVEGQLLRQVAMWRAQKKEVRELLLGREDDGFFDLVQRQGVMNLLNKVETNEDEFWLKGVFALLGLRTLLKYGVPTREALGVK